MDSLDEEFKFESPKLGKLISSLYSDLCAKPDLNGIMGRLSGSALNFDDLINS